MSIFSTPVHENEFMSSQGSKSQRDAPLKLNLGSGKNVLDGWVNLDIEERPGVLVADLTRPLPIEDDCASFIYSEHFIEHITKVEALELFKECHRIIEQSGVMRISTPNLRYLTTRYLDGDYSEWADVDFHPSTACDFLNMSLRNWGHQYVYDMEELALLIRRAGFTRMKVVPWSESEYPDLQSRETRPFHQDIIIEAKVA